MAYLYGTIDKISFIRADNLHSMAIPIDVLYNIHIKCERYTGGTLSYGIEYISSKSSKQS